MIVLSNVSFASRILDFVKIKNKKTLASPFPSPPECPQSFVVMRDVLRSTFCSSNERVNLVHQ